MAKVLEERERERCQQQHCETCRCPSLLSNSVDTREQACQTSEVMAPPPNRSNILLDSVDCNCECRSCCDQTSLHLHVEIENLQQRLLERENHIVKMETNFLSEADKFPNGEFVAMMEEVQIWQEKYNRLYEAHKKLQKVNQGLEDKLLRIVDKFETEKNAMTRDLSSTNQALTAERAKNARLQSENERYRNDVNLTIQLLQCKPANFMPQKFDSLPSDLQQKVKTYVSSRHRDSSGGFQQTKPEVRTIKVPIPTFPPTAMVYSVNKTMPGKNIKNARTI
ncbi:hypothetical protein B566_EDAN006890 [Ephemera danica]|nr:hypothetical protein B566_EDAN006890 [Ephemera danica]